MPIIVVALMLVGFVATSPFGIDPAWVALAAAAVLVGWALLTRVAGTGTWSPRPIPGSRPSSWGSVSSWPRWPTVRWASTSAAGCRTRPPASARCCSLPATALAAVLTNLSATLLLLPLLSPLGAIAVLAALLGLNIGSGLTWTGSLANLLWRRTLTRQGVHVTSWEFHRVSLTLTPVSLVAGVAVLALLA